MATAIALVTAAAICAPVLFAAPSHLVDIVRYHLDRPLEIYSTAAGVLGLWHAIDPAAASVIQSYGSANVVGPLSATALAASNIAGVAGVALVCLAAWGGFDVSRTASGRARQLVCAMTSVLAVFIATNKVGSPQYLIWLLPLGVLASLIDRRRTPLALLVATMVLAQITYAVVPSDVVSLQPWASALVLARHVGIVMWALTIAAGLRCDDRVRR